MIRLCQPEDFEAMWEIINAAAQAYKGAIPEVCWKDPYMAQEELTHEIGAGINFWGYEENGELVGVMGLQEGQEVSLIRHAYVRPSNQKKGIGSKLLSYLKRQTTRPLLVGTWAAATWAIKFYEKHGFSLINTPDKEKLLRKYWRIPEQQIKASVVLADIKWRCRRKEGWK
ncbi:MAG: GNAT family N-acetyltransferase [Thermodesulfobacteriota bacterium]